MNSSRNMFPKLEYGDTSTQASVSSPNSQSAIKTPIKIYCRIKPDKQCVGAVSTYTLTVNNRIADCGEENKSELLTLKSKPMGKKDEQQTFGFAKVFNSSCTQENVFNVAAIPIIENVLSGFNGTIFAYGQSGTGKTFTMTGKLDDPSSYGIIPRTISYMLTSIREKPFKLSVSYLQIYNETVYDLLGSQTLKDSGLQFKVSVLNHNLKNLSKHCLDTEDKAYELLKLGDSNKVIDNTYRNKVSSRSHCVFTVYTTPENCTSSSKLHLVDLAGSERFAKINAGDYVSKDAKSINLSLSFLEQVITALNHSGRNHIPYRNSVLTTILKDSLGGNSMTCFLAMISMERKSIPETISTCKFMQRVGKVTNLLSLQEDIPELPEKVNYDCDSESKIQEEESQDNFETITLMARSSSSFTTLSESNDESDNFCTYSTPIASCSKTNKLELKNSGEALAPEISEPKVEISKSKYKTKTKVRPPVADLDAKNRIKLVVQLLDHLLATSDTESIIGTACHFYDIRILEECFKRMRAEVLECRGKIYHLQNLTGTSGTNEFITNLRQIETQHARDRSLGNVNVRKSMNSVAQLVNNFLGTNDAEFIIQTSCNETDLHVLSDSFILLKTEILDCKAEINRLKNSMKQRQTLSSNLQDCKLIRNEK